MTELDRPTGLQVSAEVQREVEGIVRRHVHVAENGTLSVDIEKLIVELAQRVQLEVNRGELAEAERKGAVETLRQHSEQELERVSRGVVALWIACPRCGARGAGRDDIRHAAGCSLSSYPPPRQSMVAPAGTPRLAVVPAPARVPTDQEPSS